MIAANPLHAAEEPLSAPPLPEVRHRSVDNRGNLHDLPWKTDTRWIWNLERGTAPSLKAIIELPAGATATKIESDSPGAKFAGRHVVLDVTSTTITSKLEYRNPGGKPAEIQIVTDTKLQAPALWSDRACSDGNLSLAPKSPAPDPAPFVIAGYRCEETAKASGKSPARFRIDLYLSGEATFKAATIAKKPLLPAAQKLRGTPAFSGEIIARGTGKLGEITIQDPKSGRTLVLEVLPGAAAPTSRRWSLGFGFGFTFLSYRESGHNSVSLTQLGITPKIAGTFALTKSFDLGASVFGTALPVFSNPESARFWGVNFRVGYTLPVNWLGAIWKVLPGWYTWGMIVPDNAFGVQILAGPQLVLSMIKPGGSGIPYAIYLKYAPTAESISALSLGNHELALGGAIRINSQRAKHRIDLTLDLSRTHFVAPSAGLQMDLLTGTLGLNFDLTALLGGS